MAFRRSRPAGKRYKGVLPASEFARTTHRVQPSFSDVVSTLTKYHIERFTSPPNMFQQYDTITPSSTNNFLMNNDGVTNHYDGFRQRYPRRGPMQLPLNDYITFGLAQLNSGLDRSSSNDTIRILAQRLHITVHFLCELAPKTATDVVKDNWRHVVKFAIVRDKKHDQSLSLSGTDMSKTQLRTLFYKEDSESATPANTDWFADYHEDSTVSYPMCPLGSSRYEVVNATTVVLNRTKKDVTFKLDLPARRQMFFNDDTYGQIDPGSTAPDVPLGEDYYLVALSQPFETVELIQATTGAGTPDNVQLNATLDAVETTYLMDAV